MTTALLVKTNGVVRHIDLPVVDPHIMVHHMIGGWFDVVKHPLQEGLYAYVHTEGLSMKQEVNFAVTFLFNQIFVGDIVLCRSTENWSYTDFEIDEATINLFKSCNTNEFHKEYLQQSLTTAGKETSRQFGTKAIVVVFTVSP
jgi:hypothetical protein